METPHLLGSASTEVRSRVEAPGDASGDAAELLLLYGSQVGIDLVSYRLFNPCSSAEHFRQSRFPSSLGSHVNVMKTLVLAGCDAIDFGGKLKPSC